MQVHNFRMMSMSPKLPQFQNFPQLWSTRRSAQKLLHLKSRDVLLYLKAKGYTAPSRVSGYKQSKPNHWICCLSIIRHTQLTVWVVYCWSSGFVAARATASWIMLRLVSGNARQRSNFLAHSKTPSNSLCKKKKKEINYIILELIPWTVNLPNSQQNLYVLQSCPHVDGL
jgi:hypothetical protein